MKGKTYICLSNIWSNSENRGFKPGDEIELSDDLAEIFLQRRKIKEQAKKPVIKQSKEVEVK